MVVQSDKVQNALFCFIFISSGNLLAWIEDQVVLKQCNIRILASFFVLRALLTKIRILFVLRVRNISKVFWPYRHDDTLVY